jgi:hypothetical protein
MLANETTPAVTVAVAATLGNDPPPLIVAEEPPVEAETLSQHEGGSDRAGTVTQLKEEADKTTTLATMRKDGSRSLEAEFSEAAHTEVVG